MPSTQPADSSDKEIEAFIAQARWLLDFHNKRSEGLGTRAVALLGFSGVMLALLSRGIDLAYKLKPNALLWVALVTTVVALVSTAVFALKTLSTREVSAPKVAQARTRWEEYVDGTRRGMVLADIAETYLNSTKPDGESPISLALQEANERAACLNKAVTSIVVAFVGVAVLVVATFAQLGGGAG